MNYLINDQYTKNHMHQYLLRKKKLLLMIINFEKMYTLFKNASSFEYPKSFFFYVFIFIL